MKTLEQIKDQYKSETLDGRDLNRLSQFIPFNMLPFCGMEPKEGTTAEDWDSGLVPFNRENILIQLEKDVSFAFEKALDKRGISAGMMHEVVRMWNWILEEGLEDFDEYAQYGLPTFKATAVKYGFPNPIGEHAGNEPEYESD